jgi:hypothetical protein
MGRRGGIEFFNMDPAQVERFVTDLWSRIRSSIPADKLADDSSPLSADVEAMGGVIAGYLEVVKNSAEAIEERRGNHRNGPAYDDFRAELEEEDK